MRVDGAMSRVCLPERGRVPVRAGAGGGVVAARQRTRNGKRRRRGSKLPPDTGPLPGITARVTELWRTVTAGDGTARTEPYRLITTLPSWHARPAADPAAACARRRANETVHKEFKPYLRGPGPNPAPGPPTWPPRNHRPTTSSTRLSAPSPPTPPPAHAIREIGGDTLIPSRTPTIKVLGSRTDAARRIQWCLRVRPLLRIARDSGRASAQ